MIGIVVRVTAIAAVLAFAALPTQSAVAADFADQCLQGGGGMFSKEECACLNDNLEDDDREDVVALLKAATKAKDTGKDLDDSSPAFQKGMAALNKYEKKCSKN